MLHYNLTNLLSTIAVAYKKPRQEIRFLFFRPFHIKLNIIGLIIVVLQFYFGDSCAQGVTILDKTHYSSVLGENRNYRIFLPADYGSQPGKRYPVIYYYHGWSQRYFGSINDYKADEGDSNGGDNIANFVANNAVIVVKPDGYNRRPDEDYYLRPYNVGPVETYRQFPLYFPELVSYIDTHYRTIADRGQRAISGLSMGGFMAFWIGGKYPHLVSSVGNFCGSTEFMVGPQDIAVEYRHEEMYKNYKGMNVWLHYGDQDFIRAYHKDMNKIWTAVMDNYHYNIYEGAHSTTGLGDMFSSFMESFSKPPEKPSRWHHIDVYPSFSVWDYRIASDRKMPGFTVIENVEKEGFRSAVRTHLPDGELMEHINLTITTPPIYEKNAQYQINDINLTEGKSITYTISTDNEGQLTLHMNGGLHEIGINRSGASRKESLANLSSTSYQIENADWVTHGQNTNLTVNLLNKGSDTAKKVSATLEATNEGILVLQSESAVAGSIKTHEIKSSGTPFTFLINDKDLAMAQFRLTIRDNNLKEWVELIDIPVKPSVPEISYVIADGKEYPVAAAGDDTVSLFMGKGNGDGKANPGESIVILKEENGRYFRTLLYSTDLYIHPNGINIRKSDSWESYDHVGASAKYSVLVIDSNTPQNHEIKAFAEYWLPDYPDHVIKQGQIQISVAGSDQTPPGLEWVKASGDNVIQAKLYDGAKIKTVKAILELKDNPEKTLVIDLNNEGEAGDRVKGDLVFSKKIAEKGFGLYNITIQAIDIHGNYMEEKWPEYQVVH